MTIDFDKLRSWHFDEQRHQLTRRDTIIYALGVGLGIPASDEDQLRFLYEDRLQALPSMAAILGYRGFWLRDPATGVDWKRVLHVEHSIRLFGPLPVEGIIVSRQRISALIDKGREKGAILALERNIFDERGDQVATIEHISMLRGDGGFGGSFGSIEPPRPVPSRGPDVVVDMQVSERSALIYRLSGDDNPLHVDPTVAKAAGFPRPIIHGLCTFGIVGHAVLKQASYRPEYVRMLRGRFTAPVFPGETLRVELWDQQGGDMQIRASSVDRGVIVFDYGRALLKPTISISPRIATNQGNKTTGAVRA